jgi:hypothetical protein
MNKSSRKLCDMWVRFTVLACAVFTGALYPAMSRANCNPDGVWCTDLPQFNNPPADTTVQCYAEIPAPPEDLTATGQCCWDTVYATPALPGTDNLGKGCENEPRIITRSWTATDACNNTATWTQTITVQDTTDPEVTPPQDRTVECGDSTEPSVTGEPTVTDNCDAGLTATPSDTETPGSCPTVKVITRRWTATDACGNEGYAEQTITVQDTTDPEVTPPQDRTVECGDSTEPSVTGEPTVTDNCDEGLTATPSDTETPGSCPTVKVITRRWTATDACGNEGYAEQTITVQDTTPPQLSAFPSDVTVACNEIESRDTGEPSVTDKCDPAPTLTFADSTQTSGVGGGYPKSITRTWTGRDSCGHEVSQAQIITVEGTCDPDGDSVKDSCYECDNDHDGIKESCFACDSKDGVLGSYDGILDKCEGEYWNTHLVLGGSNPFEGTIKSKAVTAVGSVPVIGPPLAAIARNASVGLEWRQSDICCPPTAEKGFDDITANITAGADDVRIPLPPWAGKEIKTKILGKRLLVVKVGIFLHADFNVALVGGKEVKCGKDCWHIEGTATAGATLSGGGALQFGKLSGTTWCCATPDWNFPPCWPRVPPGCHCNTPVGCCTGSAECYVDVQAVVGASTSLTLTGGWNSCEGASAKICWSGLEAHLLFHNVPLIGKWEKKWPIINGGCLPLL